MESYDRMPVVASKLLAQVCQEFAFYWLVDFSRLQSEERAGLLPACKARAFEKKLWRGSRNGGTNGHSVDLDELINVSLFSEDELKLLADSSARRRMITCRRPTRWRVATFSRIGPTVDAAHWIQSAAGANWRKSGVAVIQLSTGAHEQIFAGTTR